MKSGQDLEWYSLKNDQAIEESEDKLYIYKNGESTPIYYCKSSGALCTNLAALGVIYLEGLLGPTMTKDKY